MGVRVGKGVAVGDFAARPGVPLGCGVEVGIDVAVCIASIGYISAIA